MIFTINLPLLLFLQHKKRKKKKSVNPEAKSEPTLNTETKPQLESESKIESEIVTKLEHKMEYKMESKFDPALTLAENKPKVEFKTDSSSINSAKSNKQPFHINFDSNQFSLTIDKLNLAADKNFHFKQSNKLLSKSNSSSSSGISSDSNLSNKTIKERQIKSMNENGLTNIIKNNSNSNLSTKSLFNWKRFLKLEKK